MECVTIENSSFTSCRSCRLSLLPNIITTRNPRDRGGQLRRSSLHHQISTTTVAVVVTASITALLFLVPTATTTFSHAFRSSLPRRGSLSGWKPIPTAFNFHPRSSSRAVTTSCYLFRRDNDCARRSSWNKHDSNCSGIRLENSQRIRDMTTKSIPTTTSLSSKASSFFFTTTSSSNEETRQGQEVLDMESLCNYAEQIIETNSSGQQQLHQFCVYLAGGGSMAISTLAATPGASSFLLEGRTTYDRHSYLNACEMPDKDTKGKGFSYGGEDAAGIAASAALKQALKLTSMDDDLRRMPLTIGIGCASVLVSGKGSSTGRGTVIAKAADGLVLTLNIEMKQAERSRFEEDLVLSHLVLRSAEQIMLYREGNQQDGSSAMTTNKEVMTMAGDVITEHWELPTSSAAVDTDSATIFTKEIEAVVEEAAKRVVEGGEDAVVLLPIYDDSTLPVRVRALSQTVLPNRSLLFPGSFNPIHKGHLALANASIKTLEKHEPYVHPRRHNDKPIFFELSLTNVDKPSIDPKAVASRVKKFIELASLSDKETEEPSNPVFPQQWGIVLTRAPLFEEKLRILRSKVLNRLEGPEGSPRINFVIGTDTMVRILNPKYYRDKSRESMTESLLELKASGAGFIVGGRLEQSPSAAPKFVSGKEDLVGLPDEVASMFTIMEESEFRVDLSSSQIRKKQERNEK